MRIILNQGQCMTCCTVRRRCRALAIRWGYLSRAGFNDKSQFTRQLEKVKPFLGQLPWFPAACSKLTLIESVCILSGSANYLYAPCGVC